MAAGDLRSLGDMKLSYAPPQGSKLLRERIASLHGVDPDHVLVMTGASEALIALTCLFAAPGASIVCRARLTRRCQCWRAPGEWRCANTRCGRDYGFAQTAERVLAAVDATTRAVFVNTPHNPTGFGDAGQRAAQAGRAAGRARYPAHRR